MEKPKNFDAQPIGHELPGSGGYCCKEGISGRGGLRGKEWNNCNSIINKIYF